MERYAVTLTAMLILFAGCSSPAVRIPIALEPVTPLHSPLGLPRDHVALLAKPGPSPTDQHLQGAHPIEFYVRLALARNPEIRARQQRVAAQEAVIPQATALADPKLTNTVWPIPDASFQTAAGRQANSLTLSQQLPWFGKRERRGAVALAEMQIAHTQVVETQLKVIEGVKTAYYEIYFNQRALQITEESKKFLRDYIRTAETRYTVGKASQQDILRAEVELRKLEDQQIRYKRQLKVAQADLARLIATSTHADLRTPEDMPNLDVPLQLNHLYRLALASRPELQSRLRAIFRDQQRVELAKLNYCPDVTVGFNWSLITEDGALAPSANGNDNMGLLVGINLPIWKDKLEAGVHEAQHRVIESTHLYEATLDDTLRSIRRLTAQAHALQEQIELYQRKGSGILASAEQTLNVSFADYRADKVDSLTVLSNYTQLLFFQVQVVRLEAVLGQVLASLERVVGHHLVTLPKKESVKKEQDNKENKQTRQKEDKSEALPPPRKLEGK